MAALQKFKLLATQCTVAGSPARSPCASPVIHLRRRKTLRMLLSRSSASERRRFGRRDDDRENVADRSPEKNATADGGNRKNGSKKEGRGRRKLRELFVSSPPLEERGSKSGLDDNEGLLPAPMSATDGMTARRGGGSIRQMAGTLRCRILRRAWRPVLVTIPE
ncbi:hypothetical protein SLE2022_275490 [Rubroshorea leprosula]